MTHTFGFSLGKPIGCCPVAMNNSQFQWLLMTEFLGIRRDSFRFRFVMEQSEFFFIGGLILHLFLSNVFKDKFLEIAVSGASFCIIINFIFMRIKDGSVIFDQNNLGSSNLKRILSFKCRITSLT